MKNLLPLLSLVLLLHSSCTSAMSTKRPAAWVTHLDKKVRSLESKFDGEFGVFVQDLESGEQFSYNANQFWYLSSTVKIPVAIAFLKLVEQNKVRLTDKITLKKSDYRDGAGPVNWIKPGGKVSYKYLLDQMLIYSDNTATDLIIKKVGLDNVNNVASEFAIAEDFGPITTLLDVRRKAYAEMHPDAEKLSNQSFFAIKRQRGSKKRTAQLVKELKITPDQLVEPNLDVAFDRYYAKHWNSATLPSYAKLLENLVAEKILSPKSTKKLIKILRGIQTGKKRIRRGLSNKSFYAHKTGTQHRQACDVGVAGQRANNQPKLLILVCTKKWKKLSQAEKLMARVGQLIKQANLP